MDKKKVAVGGGVAAGLVVAGTVTFTLLPDGTPDIDERHMPPLLEGLDLETDVNTDPFLVYVDAWELKVPVYEFLQVAGEDTISIKPAFKRDPPTDNLVRIESTEYELLCDGETYRKGRGHVPTSEFEIVIVGFGGRMPTEETWFVDDDGLTHTYETCAEFQVRTTARYRNVPDVEGTIGWGPSYPGRSSITEPIKLEWRTINDDEGIVEEQVLYADDKKVKFGHLTD